MDAEKKHFRSLLLGQRRRLSAQEVNDSSQRILSYLRSFPPFLLAETVILYSAEADEVQTEAIWREAVNHGKAVYYPRISADRADLEFVRRLPDAPLIPGTFNIPIPPGNHLLTGLQTTDVVLTPGVGFDREGHRLGRGRGYYDRAFRGPLARAIRVALAFSFQVVSKIPTGPKDERVHYVITGDGVFDCQNFSAKKTSGH
jgi:5-formyltetrahydrofolate cyclo-ligase